jgi:hypothetical protein
MMMTNHKQENQEEDTRWDCFVAGQHAVEYDHQHRTVQQQW